VYQEHFIDLCHLVGHPTPNESDPSGTRFAFELGAGKIRFEGWQATEGGKREVRKALRRTLAKYKLHKDEELFEKAYGYVKEYY
jgi:hypothetical protein